jgi:hypothetical protein
MLNLNPYLNHTELMLNLNPYLNLSELMLNLKILELMPGLNLKHDEIVQLEQLQNWMFEKHG